MVAVDEETNCPIFVHLAVKKGIFFFILYFWKYSSLIIVTNPASYQLYNTCVILVVSATPEASSTMRTFARKRALIVPVPICICIKPGVNTTSAPECSHRWTHLRIIRRRYIFPWKIKDRRHLMLIFQNLRLLYIKCLISLMLPPTVSSEGVATAYKLHLNGYSCSLLISCQVNKVNSPVCPTSILHHRQKVCA